MRGILAQFRGAMTAIILLSVMLNILALTSSIYLLLIYDRVLASNSLQTLTSLFIMVAFLFLFHGTFDILRTNLLGLVGQNFDQKIASRLQGLESELIVSGQAQKVAQLPMRDLDQIRNFMSSAGPGALIDLPWIFFFLIILFILHWLLGVTTLVGAIILGFLTWLNDKRSFEKVAIANGKGRVRSDVAERVRRNADTIKGLGIASRMNNQVEAKHRDYVQAQTELVRQQAFFGSIGRIFRIFVQSAVLTVGAVVVIYGQATAGIIFAAAILAGRALAPVDQAIANWRNFTSARQSWTRLNELLDEYPEPEVNAVELAAPHKSLATERIMIVPPGSKRIAVAECQFRLNPSDSVAIVGPSGSGKSSLVRGLVNIWPLARGSIRLDGAPLDQWTEAQLNQDVGYLPQEIELFNGSVAENISRFEVDAPSELITAAAQAAVVHELVLHLPDGYDTQVGDGGTVLSTGQRQRIALARALYRDPFILVLDEPDSNLDPDGEAALSKAIASVRERDGIVVVVTHRMSLLKHVNMVLVLRDGKQQAFGPRDEVLAALNKNQHPQAPSDGHVKSNINKASGIGSKNA